MTPLGAEGSVFCDSLPTTGYHRQEWQVLKLLQMNDSTPACS